MKKAIIVGGSMAGMLVGNMLIRRGWTVDILERTREGLEARGAGIVPQRSLMAALERAGVSARSDVGIHVTKRVAYDRAGAAFATHYYEQRTMSWALLYNLLSDAFDRTHYHGGKNVLNVVQDEDTAVAILEDGTHVEGDLLIGADGMHSIVRPKLFPEFSRNMWVIWHGAACSTSALQTPEFVDQVLCKPELWLSTGRRTHWLPGCRGRRLGERGAEAVQYHVVSAGYAWPASARDVHRALMVWHENGIPPDLIPPGTRHVDEARMRGDSCRKSFRTRLPQWRACSSKLSMISNST